VIGSPRPIQLVIKTLGVSVIHVTELEELRIMRAAYYVVERACRAGA
jgi:hypothetical protein